MWLSQAGRAKEMRQVLKIIVLATTFFVAVAQQGAWPQEVLIDRERFFRIGEYFILGLSPSEEGVVFSYWNYGQYSPPINGIFSFSDFSVRVFDQDSGDVASVLSFFDEGEFLLQHRHDLSDSIDGTFIRLFSRGGSVVFHAVFPARGNDHEMDATFDTANMTVNIERGIAEIAKSDIPYYKYSWKHAWRFNTQSYTLNQSPRFLTHKYDSTANEIKWIEVISEHSARVVFNDDAVVPALHTTDYITTANGRHAVWTITLPRGQSIVIYLKVFRGESFSPFGESDQYHILSYIQNGVHFLGSMHYRGFNDSDF